MSNPNPDPTLDRLLRHMAWANAQLVAGLAEQPVEALGLTAPRNDWSAGRILAHVLNAAQGYASLMEGVTRPTSMEPPASHEELAVLGARLAATDANLRAQPLQVRQKLQVDERQEGAHRAFAQLGALRSTRSRPIAPPKRRLERRREANAKRLRLLRLQLLAVIQDAKEQDPRQLRHVLERARVVRASHDVRDLLDRGVHGRGSCESASSDGHLASLRQISGARSSASQSDAEVTRLKQSRVPARS